MKKGKLLTLAMASVLAVAGCSCKKDDLTGNAKIVNEAKEYSIEKLVELAKAETGKFTVYSTSSKTKNAVEAFCAKYQIDASSCEASSYNDYELYTKLTTEIEGNVENGVDVALTQDGLTLKTTMIDTGYLINYNPVVDGAKKSDLYSFMYYVKAIGQSNEATALTNVWQLTEVPETTANYLKNPLNELINMSFLTQLTTEEWATKLAAAYKEYKNTDDAGLEAALKAGEYKNAGYMYVDKLLRNVDFNGSEGDIAKEIAKATTPAYGFGAYGKYKGKTDYTIATNLKGYSYFVYNMYAQVSKIADRPYTAMLFINYISSQEGADHWAKKDIGPGAYSTNTKVTSDQTEKLADVLNNAVVENVEAILSAPTTVEYFITNSASENERG